MNIVLIVAAYLLGAIPFGYVLVRLFTGDDIRRSGSGNIGATNAMRASRTAGILTLLLDAGKGALAVGLAQRFSSEPRVPVIAAVAVILGHVFPIFLRFRGGKGVATGCGAFALLAPYAVAAVLVLFVVVVFSSRYVSLGSIAAAALFPVFAFLFGYGGSVVWICILGSILIIARHQANIRRIFRGEEHKFSLKS